MVSALIPCKSGSLRVPRKNTRPFGPSGESLLEIKLRQLAGLSFVSEIVVSTNDPLCMEIAEMTLGERVRIDKRPEALCLDTTNLTELAKYFGDLILCDVFLWTHVTSPFFGPGLYVQAFEKYLEQTELGADSLMAVEKIQDFVLFRDKPLNFGQPTEYWPRTQDLEPVYRITSSLFLGGRTLLGEERNRIGNRPAYFEAGGASSIDIDWPHEFDEASVLLRSQPNLVM